MSPEEKKRFEKDALLHKLQDELNNLEEQLYIWEDVPDEDLYQDGELNERSAMVLAWSKLSTGEYKLMRRKDND